MSIRVSDMGGNITDISIGLLKVVDPPSPFSKKIPAGQSSTHVYDSPIAIIAPGAMPAYHHRHFPYRILFILTRTA